MVQCFIQKFCNFDFYVIRKMNNFTERKYVDLKKKNDLQI